MKLLKALIKAELLNTYRSFRIGIFVLFIVSLFLLGTIFYALSLGQFKQVKDIIIIIIPLSVFTFISPQLLTKLFYSSKKEGTVISLLASRIPSVLIWFSKLIVLFIFIYSIFLVSSFLASFIFYFEGSKPFFLLNNYLENLIFFIIAPLLSVGIIAGESILLMIFKDLPLVKNLPIVFTIGLFILFVKMKGYSTLLLNYFTCQRFIIVTIILIPLLLIVLSFVISKINKEKLI